MKPSWGSMRSLRVVAPVLLALTACQQAQPAAEQLPFTLVTMAPNASPTATPFQPSFTTPVGFNPQLALPSETPSPSATPEPEPTATVDLASLFPTAAAPPPENLAVEPTPLPPLTDSETVNFLLIGSDKRPGASYRTDTLVVVIFWPQHGQASMISIPRDLWIYIPTVGMQRINTAYQSGEIGGYAGGGPGLLRETIAYNLGIHIDHTAMVEFDGFRRIVDTLGGLEVPISCAYTDWRLIDPSYDPYDENNWWLYSVGPGQVHMDGDLALWYARSRSKSSDFDRGRRQQEVLRAMFATALRTDTIAKIPQLYADLSSTVITDLGLTDLLRLAPYAPRLSGADIRGFYIRPPYVSGWLTPGGAAVQLPNEAALAELLHDATTYSPVLEERQAIKVEVQNGSTFETLETLAASRLNYAGYETTISVADSRGYASSVLVDLTPAQNPAQRAAVLAALGLQGESAISAPDAASQIAYRVVLGPDYDPCFQPQDIPG
jgi:LCP family protein required for cell wall assembly